MLAGERLRKALGQITAKTESGPIRFTASVGVAQLEETADTLVTIMGRADDALYKAKNLGRNRVVES